jgi:hypothetical protein
MSKNKEKEAGAWMQTLWRPAMGWMYMVVCVCDMIIFPVMWSLLQAALKQPVTQWNPLSLQGAGLFHIAMGAVLGIAAFGRTQEKLSGTAANAQATTATAGFSSGATAPSVSASVPISPAPSWGTTPVPATPVSSFGGNTNQFTATPTFSSTGKPMPVQPDQPEL